MVPSGLDEQTLVKKAMGSDIARRSIGNKKVKKVIAPKGGILVNFVLE